MCAAPSISAGNLARLEGRDAGTLGHGVSGCALLFVRVAGRRKSCPSHVGTALLLGQIGVPGGGIMPTPPNISDTPPAKHGHEIILNIVAITLLARR
jgi:hypothetical protein